MWCWARGWARDRPQHLLAQYTHKTRTHIHLHSHTSYQRVNRREEKELGEVLQHGVGHAVRTQHSLHTHTHTHHGGGAAKLINDQILIKKKVIACKYSRFSAFSFSSRFEKKEDRSSSFLYMGYIAYLWPAEHVVPSA
jgi:hypothetical protein